MAETYTINQILNALAFAGKCLSDRKDEVNKLNVFPVPDGDTGTNMSLTIQSVVDNIAALPIGADPALIRKTITTGALMGARGNSGVITSQILRGLCEGAVGETEFTVAAIDKALAGAQATAFSAVRKPVEGTILTVLRDVATAAKRANKKRMSLDEALTFIASEAYASVQRTPDLLPVLKENGVVDAGGFGLAILLDSFVSALQGREQMLGDVLSLSRTAEPKVEIEQINDWEGSQYRYCNEFLVDSETLDIDEALEFLSTMGDCELCVGAVPKFKVHVHSNTPDQVLAYFLARGQISEVFIHNMQLQSAARTEALAAEAGQQPVAQAAPPKPIGFVAVAPGSGNAAILESLGVDVVVSGGQTMNPSTKDLLDAVAQVNAESVVILPDNANIIMAANSAAEVADKPVAVVPTLSVPQAFTAMFAVDPQVGLEENAEAMIQAITEVRTGEVTQAVKDSHDSAGNPIKEGDWIGIADGAILSVGQSVEQVTLDLLAKMEAEDADTLTLLAGIDLGDERFSALTEQIEEAFDDLEVDAHRGDQPLYPMILALE